VLDDGVVRVGVPAYANNDDGHLSTATVTTDAGGNTIAIGAQRFAVWALQR
jgi:hypothetical protein